MNESIKDQDKMNQKYSLEFSGNGWEYFKILIVNWLLTVITLGIYYAWGRAKKLRYIYSNTNLNKERFHFTGTGLEMFLGLIKVIGLYIVFVIVFQVISYYYPLIGLLFFYCVIVAIIPYSIHASLRYKMSRTSYRGIRFGYRGKLGDLSKKWFLGVLLTIVTFGIYSSWLQMKIRRYTHRNIRFGDINFSNEAKGGEYFLINLLGYIFSFLSLGIYTFWWNSRLFNYYYDNLELTRKDEKIKCSGTSTGGGFFGLLVGNFLIILFTLGLGRAWADIRTQKFICKNVELEGDIDINEIYQTEEEYKNAMGEGSSDYLEIDSAISPL